MDAAARARDDAVEASEEDDEEEEERSSVSLSMSLPSLGSSSSPSEPESTTSGVRGGFSSSSESRCGCFFLGTTEGRRPRRPIGMIEEEKYRCFISLITIHSSSFSRPS